MSAQDLEQLPLRPGALACVCGPAEPSDETLDAHDLWRLAAAFGLAVLAQALTLSALPEASRLIAPIPERLGLPYALLLVGAVAVFLLNRTVFGRAIYAIGNRERAAYLSGVGTQKVVMFTFAICGGLSAFGGILLAGYASKAAQAMGDPYLLPSIAAVVLGGTSILGGRGTYLGTVAGVILITLLQSILSVMQIEEWGRQVIYGVVIVAMLLLYGREAKAR